MDARTTEEERGMLRDAARRLLAREWPAEHALARAEDPEALRAAWHLLAAQGFTALGSDPRAGGLQEILIVAEELGRAACPAPFLAGALANLALRGVAQAGDLVEALGAGTLIPAFTLGPFSGDAGSDGLRASAGTLVGSTEFVEDTACASRLFALTAEGPTLSVVALEDAVVAPTPGLAVPPLAQVRFQHCKARDFALSSGTAEDLAWVARLALGARALGAADRAFEMVVDYARIRNQFGQPIGKFQAIGHKLVNNKIGLDATRLMLANAAAQYDARAGNWPTFASAAVAFAGPALRRVALETQHAFGAIGYAEEHEAPRHFRRVHADLARLGGVRHARQALAAQVLDAGASLPEYDLGPAGNAFRQEVRAWMQEHWVSRHKARYESLPFEQRTWDEPFSRALGEKGWLGLALPRSLGGQQRSPIEQYAFAEEMERVSAPLAGAPIQLMSIAAHGSPEQKAKWIPAILRGEASFGLGYSEPDSGSDLASLKTRAVPDGDDWVITGQKIWTSQWMAKYIWLAARTDPQAKPKQAGISVFIVPTNSPGLTVRPMMALHGKTFANVFYDGVRVPADALVGEVHGGWRVITGALATERNIMGAVVARVVSAFESLAAHLRADADRRGLHHDAAVRDRIGELIADIEAARQLILHSVNIAGHDEKASGSEGLVWSAMSKVFSGELMERFGETALDILGPGATLSKGSAGAVPDGALEQFLRHSIMYVVGGGTAEIQRNVIALRALGMPR